MYALILKEQKARISYTWSMQRGVKAFFSLAGSGGSHITTNKSNCKEWH